MNNFNYFAMLYLNDWKLWDEELSNGILSEDQEISREALHKAAIYYKVPRNFKKTQEPEGRLTAARSMLLAVQGPITEENVCAHVNNLAEKFRNKYEKNAVSAASKFLWLRFKSPVVILDSRATKWLYENEYSARRKPDYDSYRTAWLNAFHENEQHLETACNALSQVKPFSLASDMDDEAFNNLITQHWFKERVFDKYIWFNA